MSTDHPPSETVNGKSQDPSPGLRFGTSGLRGTVESMTDREVYISTRGFVEFLRERGEVTEGSPIALGGDLRPSTPRIMRAVARAIRDSRCAVDPCGMLPSPALAFYAFQRGIPSVMVTGSHIPADRNGVKFTKRAGEVLKSDEPAILRNIERVRQVEDASPAGRSLFRADGAFKEPEPELAFHDRATATYIQRYLSAFPHDCLRGLRIVLYQHSAVGRDILAEVFATLGAEVIAPSHEVEIRYHDEETGRSEISLVSLRSKRFVPVDTEKVTARTRAILAYLADEYHPDLILSADGDTDRPLLADEQGRFLPGDKLGLLAAKYLAQGREKVFAALPISTNDGVVESLIEMGVQVQLTRIGSPYVIAAMQAADQDSLILGWEANGGFLLGSVWDHPEGSGTLTPLPTRDAILPLLAAMLFAKQSGRSVSQLIAGELKPRYNVAAVIDKHSPGAEAYTMELGKAIIAALSPNDPQIQEVRFEGYGMGSAERARRGGSMQASAIVTLDSAGKITEHQPGTTIGQEWIRLRERLAGYFTPLGLHTILSVNFIDGVRIRFAEGNVIVHLRPSGNAPEFRTYVTADSQSHAQRILQGRHQVISALIRDVLAGKGKRSPNSW